MLLAILPFAPPKPTNKTREIRLHPAGFVGQDGILRAGWQPAPGGHSQRLKAGCQPAPQPGTFRHCILRASIRRGTPQAQARRLTNGNSGPGREAGFAWIEIGQQTSHFTGVINVFCNRFLPPFVVSILMVLGVKGWRVAIQTRPNVAGFSLPATVDVGLSSKSQTIAGRLTVGRM